MGTLSVDNVYTLGEGGVLHGPSRISFVTNPGNIIDEERDPSLVIDGSGCMILPGLIDSQIAANSATASLPNFTSFGITTVIDLSSGTADFLAMRAASVGDHSVPTYLASGSALAAPSSESARKFPFRAVRNASTPQEAERLVAELATGPRQTNYIKIIADSPGLDDATLAAAAAAARRYGKLPVAHASRSSDFRRARAAGFRILTPVPTDGQLDVDNIRQAAREGVAVIPTLCYLRQALRLTDHAESGMENAKLTVRALHEAGVRICAGTAANKDGPKSLPFGESLHTELELLASAGLSCAEAIQAATRVPAEVFGLKDRGELKVGRRADLVLVEGNPLEDILDTRRIKRVWIEGVEVVSVETMDTDGPVDGG